LAAAGADVDARFSGAHGETPLHWAASSDDVDALDALLDAGADIDAPGAVIGSGTPLDDAVAFGQWTAARRLVERGAHLDWVGHDDLTALDAARRSGADALAEWLVAQGAKTAADVV
jgi:ankyrin repeat protein